METNQHVNELGRHVAQYRSRHKSDDETIGLLSQQKLGEELGLNRSTIAFLEEGKSVPSVDDLTDICRFLRMPEELWLAATHPWFDLAMQFQGFLSEMIGHPLSIRELDAPAAFLTVEATSVLFKGKLSTTQSRDQFNSLLTYYGERPVTDAFFREYLTVAAFEGLAEFEAALRKFQSDAMRLYGNFRRAWSTFSRATDLSTFRTMLATTALNSFEDRLPFEAIDEIESARLPDLGYIAVQRIEKETRERRELSEALEVFVSSKKDASEKKLARIRTLLRRFESPLADQIEYRGSLFDPLSSEEILAEAKRIAPEEADLAQIEMTQQRALKNLSVYLSEPYMDVYVATSMRADADFLSVNNFVQTLFKHSSLACLNLRYFNPTQSWIGDRVAKGLVEALMLRRSAVTVYMAQKSDTFGKDSEASVALGQGKTVIVYVPRLYDDSAELNSERIFQMTTSELATEMVSVGLEVEEGTDSKEQAAALLAARLKVLSKNDFCRIVWNHWADFDLQGELTSVKDDTLRMACVSFVDDVRNAASPELYPETQDVVRSSITDALVNASARAESRAKTFRDIHPLSLQVIVESGVLNGILVSRSVNSCAELIRAVISNTVQTRVVAEPDNYRLIEETTGSTLRVVSRHQLLTNAFWTQYFQADSDGESLPVGTI